MDSNFKAEYQEYRWCYQKFIVEGKSHREMAEEAGCTERTIKKWCVEKHRIKNDLRRKIVKFNEVQNDLIIGSILGDGHITNKNYLPIFIVSHAEDQKDYLYWKYEIMQNICNSSPREYSESIKIFDGKEYNAQKFYRFNTRSYHELEKYRNLSKIDVIKSLNEFSLSIWVLDDGHRHRSNWSLCVADFSNLEKDYMIDIFKRKFGLDSYIKEFDQRYIFFRATSSREIDKMILKTMPNDLDIINKKIIHNKNIGNPAIKYSVIEGGNELGLKDFCKIHRLSYMKARKMYLSGVTDRDSLIQNCEMAR